MKKIKIILTFFFAIYFRSKAQIQAAAARPKVINPAESVDYYPELVAQKAAEIEAEIIATNAVIRRKLLTFFKMNRGKDVRGLIILTIMYVKRFPIKWSDFNDFVVPATAYLDANKVRLQLIIADLDTLLALINDPATGWVFVYGKITNSSTNAKNWRDRRDILRNEIVLIMNTMEDGIRQALLTPEDRIALHLPEANHTHTPVIKMPVAPNLSMETMTHLQHILRLKNPLTPDSDAMPDGQHIIMEYFVGPAGMTEDKIDFSNARTITTFLYGVAFDATQAGQTIYYRVCYENRRGKRSVWSATLPQVIA